MGWDLLVNQIIASAVDSEEVHKLLYDLLPSSGYYRLNPVLHGNTYTYTDTNTNTNTKY